MLGPKQEDAPFGVAVASVAGAPQEAIDAFWTCDMINVATHRLMSPSDKIVTSMIAAPDTTAQHHALAACLRDSKKLDQLIAAHPDTADSSADNLFLTVTAAKKLVAAGCTVETIVAKSLLTGMSTAQEIVLARGATLAADLLEAGQNTATIDALNELLVTGDDPNAGDHRRFRAALYDLLGTAKSAFVTKVAGERNVRMTSSDFKAVIAEIDAGSIDDDDVLADIDAEGYVWASLTGNRHYYPATVYGSRKAPFVDKGAKLRASLGQTDSTADEAELLFAMGMPEVACRAMLESKVPVTSEQLDKALDHCDVETFVDWAENRLSVKPAGNDVVEQIHRLGVHRMQAVSVEVARRPDPVEQCQDLILITPGIASKSVSPKAARAMVQYLTGDFGLGSGDWTTLASLLSDRMAGDTVIELAAAAKQITL